MQYLVSELAKEEDALLDDKGSYPVWLPHRAFDAADTLLAALAADAAREN